MIGWWSVEIPALTGLVEICVFICTMSNDWQLSSVLATCWSLVTMIHSCSITLVPSEYSTAADSSICLPRPADH